MVIIRNSNKKILLLVLIAICIGCVLLRAGSVAQVTAENELFAGSAEINWSHLSSSSGDLPVPTNSTQQTSTLILDIDKDGLNDFVIAARRSPGPSLIWYRRHANGWDKYIIDDTVLRIEAGGTFTDIDDDGDLDIVMGGDGGVNTMWWWENPYPNYNHGTNWTRRIIKNSGANKHHDQLFGDFDGDGRDELVYWNQGAKKLFLAEIPANKNTSPWPATAIYTWTSGGEHEGLAKADIDGDGLEDIVGGGRWFKYNGGTSFSVNIIDTAQTFTRSGAGQLKEGGYAEAVFVIGDGIGPLKWYEWDGSNWIGHALLNHDVDHGHSLQVADIDSDGHLDIFVAEMRVDSGNPDAKMWIFYGDGQGNFTTSEVSSEIGSHEAKVGDLDGDGDFDILGKPYNWDTPRVDVWLSDLICEPSLDEWERHEIDSAKPWTAVFVDSADLDGDTLEDVITGGWWYKNPGNAGGNWERKVIGSPLNNFATAADFDRDGDIDILGTEGTGSTANQNFVWARNDGSGSFTILDNIDAGVGDFLQGVAVNAYGGATEEVALSWHKSNKGTQMLSIPADASNQPWEWREISTTTQHEDLSAGDIDRDGDLDLLLGTKWLRNETTADPTWTDSTRRYRLPVTVNANGFNRQDKPAEIALNFSSLLSTLGESGTFDINSIRVVEVNESKVVLNDLVAHQFDQDSSFNATSNALGTLVFMLDGATAGGADRHFDVYFDVQGAYPFPPPSFSPRVVTSDDIEDAGELSFKIETENGTYFYHKEGGGFSSLNDSSGNDWINHNTASGSAGEYRGIPNMVHPSDGGYFHPGSGTIISSLTSEGPLKTTIHSTTADSLWEISWEIYPNYARMTVLQAAGNYWFLYEGTPGGTLDIDDDQVVRSNGTQSSAAASWTEAIAGEEWLYFNDPAVGRSLYLAHHEQDNIVDSYWPMNEEMTVFGFGRDGNLRHLHNGNQFTIGLTDETTRADVAVTVNGAYRDLAVSLGAAESSSNPALSGPWSSYTLSNAAGDPDRNKLADINGDGRLDAVVGYEAINKPGLLAWYEGPATATNLWSEHSIATITGPMSVDTADMDGDGDLDVIAGEHSTSNPTSAKLYVFENVDGEGQSWQQHLVYTGDEHHDGAQVVDIDNDGDLDIISIGWTHGRVVVYENKSCTGSLPPNPTPTATSAAATATSAAPTATSDAATATSAAPTATSTGPTATSAPPTATATPIDPSSCTPDPGNILANPGFESGTANWAFYSNANGNFSTSSPAFQCEKAAQITLTRTGSNMQLFQRNFLLKANTKYRLSFAATSSTGHDLVVYLHQHTKPYTKYGINGQQYDLTQSWQTYTTEFTSTGFSGTTSDTRLRFWFSGAASNGDVYWIDDVLLEEVDGSPTPTAVNTATPTAVNTATPTAVNTATPTAVNTATPTAVNTATPTAVNTATPTAVNTATATAVNTATPTPDDPSSCLPDANNVLANPGFESGTSSWIFYTSGNGGFATNGPAYQCQKAAQVTLNTVSSNMQLYQKNFLLKANTDYRLSFAATSNSGDDVVVYLHRHTAPYTKYGINGLRLDLTQSWQTYSTEFTTTGFAGTTSDTRLRFWLSGVAKNGDVYLIDDVVLEEVNGSATATPSQTPNMTKTPDNTSTPTPVESHTPTATATASNTPEPSPTGTPTATPGPTATPDDPTGCTPGSSNIIANPGFESGSANWLFYANSSANFTAAGPAYQCETAARVTINTVGSNMQLYQKGFLLQGNTRYRLSFAAFSSSSSDLAIYLHKHSKPYTNFGLGGEEFNLAQGWQAFSTEFTSSGFSGTTSDTRLRFWFPGLASSGDVYWIDDIQLEEIGAPSSGHQMDLFAIFQGSVQESWGYGQPWQFGEPFE